MIEILERPVIPRKVELYPPPIADSVLYFPGYPPKSSTIEDRHGGTAHDGTITGATWVREKSGLWILSYDGTDDYVAVSDHADLDFTTKMSAIVWVKLTALTTKYQCLLSKRTSGDESYLWDIESSTDGGQQRFYNGTGVTSTTAVPTGAWTMLGFTYDNSNIDFYLNGVADGTPALAGPLTANNQPLWIGHTNSGSYPEWFAGKIGLIQIFNATLTATQMLFIYQWHLKWAGV